jgi:hypothetical protein
MTRESAVTRLDPALRDAAERMLAKAMAERAALRTQLDEPQ